MKQSKKRQIAKLEKKIEDIRGVFRAINAKRITIPDDELYQLRVNHALLERELIDLRHGEHV